MAQNAAIIVGIDEYANSAYCLDSCVNDALNFALWALSATGGDVDPARIKLLLSPSPGSGMSVGEVAIPVTGTRLPYEAATRRNIIRTIGNPPGSEGRLY